MSQSPPTFCLRLTCFRVSVATPTRLPRWGPGKFAAPQNIGGDWLQTARASVETGSQS